MILDEYFTAVYDWITILQLLCVSFAVVFVICPAKRDLKGWLRIAAETLALFIAETFTNAFFFAVAMSVEPLQGVNFTISHFVVISVYVAFYIKNNPKSKLVLSATMFVTAIDVSAMSEQAGRFLSGVYQGYEADWVFIISDLFIVGFALVVKRFSVDKFDEIPTTSVCFHLICVVVSTGYIIMSIVRELPYFLTEDGAVLTMRTLISLSYFLIYVADVMFYLAIYFHCRDYSDKVTAEVENSLLKAAADMMVVSDQAMEEVREIRHDIGNQYAVIKVMLKEKKYDELEKYFASMNIEFEDIVRFVNSKNSLLNSIVNMEILKAQSYNIRLVCVMNVPEKLPMSDTDISRILINLTDNSIEALRRVDTSDKIIDLNISYKNDYLYITVQNVFDSGNRSEEEVLELNTQKHDYKNHGYGHKIVRKIVDKYRGEINYSIENDEFIVEVMLDLKSQAQT